MKVLQFAFDPSGESVYLPYRYDKNCIVYTGTHDNDTTKSWVDTLSRKELAFVKKYLGVKNKKDICSRLVRAALESVADTVIIPMQDYLELGHEARINTPSTLGGNWEWRMDREACTQELLDKMFSLAHTYGRIPRNTQK
jgi:4-alpha-glucanotransferase